MIKNPSEEKYKLLYDLMMKSLTKLKSYISKIDYDDVVDFINNDEYGVGWELIWHIVNESRIPIPEELVLCGRKMGFNVSEVKY